jgi:hypothetical protein
MIDEKDTSPAPNDGKHEFDIYHAGRELKCTVIKEQDKLSVCIDDNINAELTLQSDGSLTQTGGNDLPESSVEYIKKRIFG